MERFQVKQALAQQESIQAPVSVQEDVQEEKVVKPSKIISLDDDNFGKY